MFMKLGKFVTYGEMDAPMNSHVPLTTWLREVTRQTKNEIFFL